MNTKSRFGLAAVLLVFVIGAAALNVSGVQAAGKPTDVPGGGGGSGRGGQAVANTNAAPAALAPLTAQEADGLLFMVQEEQLARDVYARMYATWQIPMFQTIAASEQNHMDRVAGLLTRYGLTAPARSPVSLRMPNCRTCTTNWWRRAARPSSLLSRSALPSSRRTSRICKPGWPNPHIAISRWFTATCWPAQTTTCGPSPHNKTLII